MTGKKPQTWKFTAPMERTAGKPAWCYVEFPHDVLELFGKRGEVRMKCVINGVAADRALMPTKSGIHIIVLGADLRKQAGIKKVGDMVRLEVRLDPDPDRINVPEELQETLDFMPEMERLWNELTPGMKRNMCYWVGSAKTAPTRAKRIAEVMEKLETGYFKLSQSERTKRNASRS